MAREAQIDRLEAALTRLAEAQGCPIFRMGFHSPRARVVGQGVNPRFEATLHLRGQSPEVALRCFCGCSR